MFEVRKPFETGVFAVSTTERLAFRFVSVCFPRQSLEGPTKGRQRAFGAPDHAESAHSQENEGEFGTDEASA